MSAPAAPEAGAGTVRCCRCGESKPPEMFARNRSKPSGRNSICRGCMRKYRAPPQPPKGPHVTGGLLPPRPDQRFSGKPGPPLAVVRVGPRE